MLATAASRLIGDIRPLVDHPLEHDIGHADQEEDGQEDHAKGGDPSRKMPTLEPVDQREHHGAEEGGEDEGDDDAGGEDEHEGDEPHDCCDAQERPSRKAHPARAFGHLPRAIHRCSRLALRYRYICGDGLLAPVEHVLPLIERAGGWLAGSCSRR